MESSTNPWNYTEEDGSIHISPSLITGDQNMNIRNYLFIFKILKKYLLIKDIQ
jgi:hypothetical protein